MVVVVGALPARLFVCARGVCVEGTKFSSHMEPPPPPPHLTPYSQDFYDAFHRPQRKPPPDVKAAMAALSQHPLQAACTIPGLLAHLRAYIQVWAPLVSTQRTHREGERAVCAHPATHAVPPSLPPFTMSHPFPPPPPYTARTCPSQILLLRPLQQGCSTARCRPSQCPESGSRTVQETPEARHSHCRGRRLHGPACNQRLWETTRAADAAQGAQPLLPYPGG